ncbi:DUF6137 domain-containing protein [Sodalis endosymbiont of Spalangia cameroni]|uniref:DUF6137 domain-containing protein n=1 Tax=Sodalis praecaptivus TaxID=1239307 RepID=UPI0031F7AAAF
MTADYIRKLIYKIACDTTGEAAEMINASGRLTIPARDAIEFMVRLEALLDCSLGWTRYQPLTISVDELTDIVHRAYHARASAGKAFFSYHP